MADIHFDYRLAIAAMEAGADKIRINPGNIGSTERVRVGRGYGKGAADSDPCRGQQRFSGKRDRGASDHGVTAEGHCRECAAPVCR